MRWWGGVLVLIAVVAAAPSASAHPVPFSYLDLHLNGPGAPRLEGTLVIHAFDLAHELQIDPPERIVDAPVLETRLAAIQTMLGARFGISADGEALTPAWTGWELVPDVQSVRFRFSCALSRAPGVVRVSARMFPYDPNHRTFVNIYERTALRSQAILDAKRSSVEHFTGSTKGVMAIGRRFAGAGIHHILIGPDHLLFLVGLLLLGGSVRRLLIVVTAFTLAHSITLSVAALGIFSPPVRVVEPLIALSIVYVGADNLLIRGGRDMRAWIALVFGLVHGFGFAGILREMGLPAQALGWSLFSFNAGVEIGQLMVVVLVASALAALRHQRPAAAQRLAYAGSVAVVAAGAFWFVQRVFFVGGSI
jgi:hydrogenase/urease accessory protein HupE